MTIPKKPDIDDFVHRSQKQKLAQFALKLDEKLRDKLNLEASLLKYKNTSEYICWILEQRESFPEIQEKLEQRDLIIQILNNK